MNWTVSRSTSTSAAAALSKKPSQGAKFGWWAATITGRSQAYPDGLVRLGEVRLHLQAADTCHRLDELVAEVRPRDLELALVLRQRRPLALQVPLVQHDERLG